MHSLHFKLWISAGLLLTVLIISGCQGVGPAGTPIERTEPEKTASEAIEEQTGPASERVLIGSLGGQLTFRHLKLTIPSGAVSTEAYVQVQMAPGEPEGFVRESAYLLTPNDLVLNKPALLAIHYFDDDLAADESEEDITIVQDIGGQWMPLAGVSLDTYNNIATTQITKFATYALQVIPRGKPMINVPPVARLTYELVTPEEEKAKAAAAAEVGVAAEGAPAAEAAPPAGGIPPETAGQMQKPEASKEVPAEGSESEAPVTEAAPPASEQSNDARMAGTPPVPRGEGEVSTEPGGSDEALGQSSGEAAAQEMPPAGELIEPPGAEPGEKGFLVKPEAAPEAAPPQSGYTVEFSAKDSSDEDGNIVAYFWDLGADGVIDYASSQPGLRHHYDTYGSVLAILRVEDDQEPVGSDLTSATVSLLKAPDDPIMPFEVRAVAFPAVQQVGDKVVLGASVTGGVPPYNFAWELPDGSTSEEQTVLLPFDRPGRQTFKLTVSDAEGAQVHRKLLAEAVPADRMAEGRIRVRLKPQSVSLERPGEASFSVEVKNGRPPYRLEVDTGVGEPATIDETDFKASFDNTGYFIVTLLLTDVQGRSAKAFVPVSVGVGEEGSAGVEPALGRLSFVPEFARDSLRVSFTPRELPQGASVSWDFGDGTQAKVESPKKLYAKPGVYRVHLRADDGFRLYERQRAVPVGGGELAAAIDLPSTVCGIAPLGIRPRAIVSGGAFPLFYRWSLGDLYGEGERPRFILDQPGDYQLQLTVSDGKGVFFDTDPVEVKVYRAPPDYRYPIAFIQRDQEADALQIGLTEFDGSARATFPPFAADPQSVNLAPGGRLLAVSSGGSFRLYQLGSGSEVFSFIPSHGRMESLLLSASKETLAFNVESDLGGRGYLYQKESGIVPVGGDAERVLDLTPDGKALLALDREGTAHLYALDPFVGSTGKPLAVMKGVAEGRLLGDASSAVLLGVDNQVYRVAIKTGERAQITADARPKFNLAVSLSGSVIAYNLEGGEIVVAQKMAGSDGAPPFPLNISQLNGFSPSRWSLSPDGKLLVGYGSVKESEGLYLVNLSYDLTKVTAAELAPHFLVKSTPQFAVGASLKPFDRLLAPPEEAGAEEPSAPQ